MKPASAVKAETDILLCWVLSMHVATKRMAPIFARGVICQTNMQHMQFSSNRLSQLLRTRAWYLNPEPTAPIPKPQALRRQMRSQTKQ